MCYIDLLYNSAGAFCVWVKAIKNEFSTDLEIGGGAVIQTLKGGGGAGRCPKICCRFGLKIEGRKGPGPQGPSPGCATDILVT